MDTLSWGFEERKVLENFMHDRNGGSGESVKLIRFDSTMSSPGVQSNTEKLEKTDVSIQESTAGQFSIANSELPCPEPSLACRKRGRTDFQLQVPVCKVHGCNKDLSSSKDYYKRHKVCDVHSKTAVVVISNVQQRFCQQCSRFHMLQEFDGDKRSCRKRLAGHNKRRRKPQLIPHFGSAFFQRDIPTASLLYSRILPGGIISPQYNDQTEHNAVVKLENMPYVASQLAVPSQFGFSLPKSVLHLDSIVKQYPSSNLLKAPLSLHNLSPATNSSSAIFLLSGLKTELIERLSRYVAGASSGH